MQPRTIVPFGPQHPVLPEPIQLKITYEDEKVVDVVPAMGYVHRGIEKACELNEFNKNIYLCERICGICSCIHGIAYCEVVERLWGLEVPERAQWLRTIWSEMERVHSHLLWLGLFADAFGFESLFMQYWRVREKILDMLELTAGHRVTHSVSIIGGVRRDIDTDQKKRLLETLAEIRREAQALNKVMMNDYTVKHRTVGKGPLTYDQALHLGCAGPVLRASGVKDDARMQPDLHRYGELGFEPVVETGCDSYARALVRARETIQSIDLQLAALEKLPEGELAAKPKGNPPAEEAVFRTEQPRGEMFYYAKGSGTKNVARVRVRTPTYANIPSLLVMLPGSELPDVPVIIHSIDPCISCTER
ncbi:MAG: nickel-dependent hydrogenase large subunit [Candidatus Eremiobacteraeota bacterium]|nr:nickel-dependent hydrogenase large subunit [Candidatus Eremiobacteraeota bacterium]